MKCNKKVCNVCEGTFKPERGCTLEKRCPACRFLKLQKNGDKPLQLSSREIPEIVALSYEQFPTTLPMEIAVELRNSLKIFLHRYLKNGAGFEERCAYRVNRTKNIHIYQLKFLYIYTIYGKPPNSIKNRYTSLGKNASVSRLFSSATNRIRKTLGFEYYKPLKELVWK